jgi:alginate production protein
MNWRWLDWILIAACLVPLVSAQDLTEVQVGRWVVVKGRLVDKDRFVADSVELSAPEGDEEELIGDVTEVARDDSWFLVLGMRVTVNEGTRWRNLDGVKRGTRVKVLGHYRGLRKFSASSVSARGAGRDRIAGRVDERRQEQGLLELDVMRWRVQLPLEVQYVRKRELDDYPVLQARGPSRMDATQLEQNLRTARDDDDDIPVTLRLSDELDLGMRLEYERTDETNFDLDAGTTKDRIDDQYTLRTELLWSPDEHFYALLGLRHRWRTRDDEKDGYTSINGGKLSELYGYWKDIGGHALDLQMGRQDFDEQREWLWDENLDAVRLIWYPARDWRLELAAVTTLRDTSEFKKATTGYLAHLRVGDDDRSLGAWILDSRTDLEVDTFPFLFGARALGDWVPDNEVWLEVAGMSGYEGNNDLRGFAYDLGSTWSPEYLDPWYFTAGYAFGSGDSNPNDSVDRSFRQTGFQDNNDKFGGVTSFKYYGELLQPELSNMGIFTVGVGRRFARRHSLDLVYHRYTQDSAANRLRDGDLNTKPNGISRDLGQEMDLILGARFTDDVLLEFVLAQFMPGDAFPGKDDAFLGRIQLRIRF